MGFTSLAKTKQIIEISVNFCQSAVNYVYSRGLLFAAASNGRISLSMAGGPKKARRFQKNNGGIAARWEQIDSILEPVRLPHHLRPPFFHVMIAVRPKATRNRLTYHKHPHGRRVEAAGQVGRTTSERFPNSAMALRMRDDRWAAPKFDNVLTEP